MTGITDFYSPSADELEEEEKKLEEFLETETPSLDQGLVELRQKFIDEEERRRDLESKAAGILAVSGLLLALLQFLHQGFVDGSVLLLMALLLLVSILLSLANLVPIGYMSPEPNSILSYTFEGDEQFTRKMYNKYHISIYNNKRVNDRRLRILHWSYNPLVLVILLLAGILIYVSLVEIL